VRSAANLERPAGPASSGVPGRGIRMLTLVDLPAKHRYALLLSGCFLAGCQSSPVLNSEYIAPRVTGRVMDAVTTQPIRNVSIRRLTPGQIEALGAPGAGDRSLERSPAVRTNKDGGFDLDSERDLTLFRQHGWYSVTLALPIRVTRGSLPTTRWIARSSRPMASQLSTPATSNCNQFPINSLCTDPKPDTMKQLLILLTITTLLAFVAGCATTPTQRTEKLLVQSGFKALSASTPDQQQQIKALPPAKLSPIKRKGQTYYVFPDPQRNVVYVGKKAQYQAYQIAVQDQYLAQDGKLLRDASRSSNYSEDALEMSGAVPTFEQMWEGWPE
jgi:hypothetical protein